LSALFANLLRGEESGDTDNFDDPVGIVYLTTFDFWVCTKAIDKYLSKGFPTQGGGVTILQVEVMGKQHSQRLGVIHGWL
jgi:hypothetical protein